MRQTRGEGRQPLRHATDGQETAARYQSREEHVSSASTDPAEVEAEIRRRAYERYVSRGDGPGSDVEDWCAAERDVRETPRSSPA